MGGTSGLQSFIRYLNTIYPGAPALIDSSICGNSGGGVALHARCSSAAERGVARRGGAVLWAGRRGAEIDTFCTQSGRPDPVRLTLRGAACTSAKCPGRGAQRCSGARPAGPGRSHTAVLKDGSRCRIRLSTENRIPLYTSGDQRKSSHELHADFVLSLNCILPSRAFASDAHFARPTFVRNKDNSAFIMAALICIHPSPLIRDTRDGGRAQTMLSMRSESSYP